MINYEVTIPVLNEEPTLVNQVNNLIKFIEDNDLNFNIAIADNGSIDRTRELAKAIVSKYPDKVRLVCIDKKGVGLALKEAWKTSNADVVGYMDLDFATDLNHLLDVERKFEEGELDILYASRLVKGSKVIGRTFKREISSRVFNMILKVYLDVKFSDGMCGFKFLKREKLKSILTNGASNDGWFFCTEVLYVAEKKGLFSYELPVKWTDDNESKVNIINLTVEYLKAMRNLKNGKN